MFDAVFALFSLPKVLKIGTLREEVLPKCCRNFVEKYDLSHSFFSLKFTIFESSSLPYYIKSADIEVRFVPMLPNCKLELMFANLHKVFMFERFTLLLN